MSDFYEALHQKMLEGCKSRVVKSVFEKMKGDQGVDNGQLRKIVELVSAAKDSHELVGLLASALTMMDEMLENIRTQELVDLATSEERDECYREMVDIYSTRMVRFILNQADKRLQRQEQDNEYRN